MTKKVVLVALKRVVAANVLVCAKSDETGVDIANVKMSMNPYDEIALEAAIQLKERGEASEVVAVSCGTAACEDVLRMALGMGADRAMLVETQPALEPLEPLAVAKLLVAIAKQVQPALVMFGKQSIDEECNQTGQMFAALADWPQATSASRMDMDGEALIITREVDDGTQTLRLALPAVVTAELGLAEPRYISLPNLMKARKKVIERCTPEALGVDVRPRLKTLKVSAPRARAAGEILSDVTELVDRLKQHAKVI